MSHWLSKTHLNIPNHLFSKMIKEEPEFLPEAAAEVLCKLVAVLQTRQQEATALEQQHRLGRTQEGALPV